MKFFLWTSFYVLSFAGMILAMYMKKDDIYKETEELPVLNYTQYHRDAQVVDSTYVESVDSLAVVIEGLLGELTGYIQKLNERDNTIREKTRENNKLRQENNILKKQINNKEAEKVAYSKEMSKQRLEDLAKTIGELKGDVLGPILTNMPDDVIKILYDKAKAKDRPKIFNALPSERAAKIMTQMARTSSTGK